MSREGFVPEPLEKPLPADPLGVTVHRLANGLTAYLSPNTLEPRVSYEIVVRAGSRHDPPEATGMAHYLEHMQFKGTTRLGTLDYAREKPHLDRIEALYDELFKVEEPGRRARLELEIDRESQEAARWAVPNELDRVFSEAGFTDLNARTGYDETVYSGSFPANRAELWARVEAERLAAPVYRLFLPELETVYEEYNRSRDDAEEAFYYAGMGALFKGHPYGRDIIGLGAHLKNPSLSRMREFFLSRYRVGGMAVVLSGDFDRASMFALLERAFGGLAPAAAPPPPAAALRRPRGVERGELRYQAEEKVRLGWLLCGRGRPDEDALTLLDMLMDNRWAGILNLSVNKAQKVKDSGSFPLFLDEAGGWFVTASPKEGQSLEEAEAILLEAVGRLKAGGFGEEDLQAVITDFEVREKKRLEKNGDRAAFIGRAFAGGVQWRDFSVRLERLKGVGKADVLRAAERYLGGDRIVLYRRKGRPGGGKVAKPAFSPISIDPARQSSFFRELSAMPAAPLVPRFLRRGRDYRMLERGWGRLIWTANPVNDLCHLELRFDFGAGVCRRLKLALQYLELCGAGGLSVDEFERALYRLGFTLKAGCDERECAVELAGPEAGLQEALRLALLRFSRPNAVPGTFERMLAVERGDRKDRKLDPKKVFGALREFASRGKDSPVLRELGPAELDELREDELKEVLSSVFERRRAALYTGGREAEAAARLLSSAEGRRGWKAQPSPRPIRLLAPERARVVFVHREGLSQAVLAAYAADGPFDAGLRLDYRLYNAVMGGMSGAYFQEVREARALAYDASGGYRPGEAAGDDGRVWAYAGTQADKAGETALLLRELLLRPPLTGERFAAAFREAEENYRTLALRLEEIPLNVHGWRRLGLAGDPRAASFRELRGYPRRRLERFAARWSQSPLTFCVLGDRARLDLEGLKALGCFEERGVDELFPF